MPLIKKQPAIMTRSSHDGAVSELRRRPTARFIESSNDHGRECRSKEELWRDQEYRQWREATAVRTARPDKAQPTEREEGLMQRDSNRRGSSRMPRPWPPNVPLAIRNLFPEEAGLCPAWGHCMRARAGFCEGSKELYYRL